MNSTAHISLPMAIIIGINAIVGASIFVAPAALQVTTGPAALITYGLVSIAALFLALALARVATLYPEKGAFYTYAKAWGGHTWGVIAMMSYTIGLVVALGLVARATGDMLSSIFTTTAPLTLSILLVALLVAANLAGALIAKTGQIILMVLTYLPIAVISVLCLLKADTSNLHPFMPHGWMSIFQAVPLVIFGFFGFESIPSLFSEIKDPERNVPKAVTLTILLVGVTYMLFASAIFLGLPSALFTSGSPDQLSAALISLYPNFTWLVSLINWAIIIALTGVLHSMIWSLSALIVDTSSYILPHDVTVSRRKALLLLGGAIIASCVLFRNHNLNFMFDLTALFIVFAYATALLPLLVNKQGRSPSHIIIAVVGLLTAIVIFGCGILGIMKALA